MQEPAEHDVTLPTESTGGIARFLASMTITFDMWHDGAGYDLAALASVTPSELQAIETTLIDHSPADWRDIEALAQIDSDRARAAVRAALTHADPKIRREALKYAGEQALPADREALLLKGLESDDLFGGLSEAIDEAAEFHPPAVVDALLRGARDRGGPTAIHFAALLYYIHGKASEPFDWDQRPFFLRFDTPDRAERLAAFQELCETIGVDAAKCARS